MSLYPISMQNLQTNTRKSFKYTEQQHTWRKQKIYNQSKCQFRLCIFNCITYTLTQHTHTNIVLYGYTLARTLDVSRSKSSHGTEEITSLNHCRMCWLAAMAHNQQQQYSAKNNTSKYSQTTLLLMQSFYAFRLKTCWKPTAHQKQQKCYTSTQKGLKTKCFFFKQKTHESSTTTICTCKFRQVHRRLVSCRFLFLFFFTL